MSQITLKRILSPPLIVWLMAAIFIFYALNCCAPHQTRPAQNFSLDILHLNDTHSHIDPEEWTVNIDGVPTKVQLGGYARVMKAVKTERMQRKHSLLLHAGDAFQGTLYFVAYEGKADAELLNLMSIDAMTAGNHEFDKGPLFLTRFIDSLKFQVVSANVEAPPSSELSQKIRPYVIKEIGGEKIGIIGLTTVETKHSSSPGGVRFSDPVTAAGKCCRELTGLGINKIIVLSHLGFDMDRKLARSVSGIDLIVGGHSHTALGEYSRFRIDAADRYPARQKSPAGEDVLIVQAWEWGKILGGIELSFDTDGNVVGSTAHPVLIAGAPFKQRWKDTNGDRRIDQNDDYSEVTEQESPQRYAAIRKFITERADAVICEDDGQAKKIRDRYAGGLHYLTSRVVGVALEDLTGKGNDTGAGPLVADSFLEKTRPLGAVIAVENVRALRSEVNKGAITAGRIYELLPFKNTLVVIDLSAEELQKMFEEAIDHALRKMAFGQEKYLYISGARLHVDTAKNRGSRVSGLKVLMKGKYQPVVRGGRYRIVTNSFLAAGGDNFNTLKNSTSKTDTGFIDAEVFLDYVKNKKTLKNPTEKRLRIIAPPEREN